MLIALLFIGWFLNKTVQNNQCRTTSDGHIRHIECGKSINFLPVEIKKIDDMTIDNTVDQISNAPPITRLYATLVSDNLAGVLAIATSKMPDHYRQATK